MTHIRRRDLVRVVAAAAAAATAAVPAEQPAEKSVRQDKRRPQYQANSTEVQTFYRVNRYPAK
jgi:hypothetical protein